MAAFFYPRDIDCTVSTRNTPNGFTLTTKVLLPRRREDVLTRQRLLDRLYDVVDRKLVLVSAPAGYGKTTLLVDFAHDLEHSVCWYSLDEGDRDPRVFLEHLVLSLQHRFPSFGERTRQALAANPDVTSDVSYVVDVLLDEVEQTIPQWFLLVLDDFHCIDNSPEITNILAQCLTRQSDQFLLAVSSRTVPRLPLIVRFTARDQIGGIGAEDLRFRPKEIQSLLARNYDVYLPEDKAEQIAAQSEGWITGILLTTHTMWQGILVDLVQARTSGQPVFEYLAQEVFAHQDSSVQDFLLASSILQEMSPSLCQDVLGVDDAEHSLTLLEDRNLFLTRLDNEWCRYHQLFQEYLVTRLQREQESRWRELHLKAADWFEAHKQPVKAAHHYLAVEAFEQAAQVMEAEAQKMFYSGHLDTLITWGEALPDRMRAQFPRLTVFLSRAADMLGRWSEALELAKIAEVEYRFRGDDEGVAYALLHRCEVWQKQGRYHEALELGKEVLSHAQRASVPVAYEAHRILGRSCLTLGRLEEAEEHLRRALDQCEGQARSFERASIQDYLADCLWGQERWEEAIAVQRQVVEYRRERGNPGPLAGALNDLGFYRHSMGACQDALHLLEEALELSRRAGHRRNEALTLLSLAELGLDIQALEWALEVCQEGLETADRLGDGFLSGYGREVLGLVLRGLGDYATAQEAIEQAVEWAEKQRSDRYLGRYEASLGLVMVENGVVKEGLERLEGACRRLEQIDAQFELARARFLDAWAKFQAGQETEALSSLQRALSLANSSGRVFYLVAEGCRALPLLNHAIELGTDGDELELLLPRVESFQATARDLLQTAQPVEQVRAKHLQIYGFGMGRVVLGDEEIPVSDWEAAAPRQMLFYVLMNSPCTRAQIVSALWPELSKPKVKASFHTTKFRLHRAIGREIIRYDGHAYGIHPELDYWFDVVQFEQLLEEASQDQRVERLQEALALYQGDFLQDFYSDWHIVHREALRERYMDGLDELARRFMARRQYSKAIEPLRRGLEADDLRESFHRQLMRAFALSGRKSEAIAQYQHCAAVLERELKSSPSPETTALHQRILESLPLD
jgi:ATP/maltotriose-dependent transcriptional regulator MalT/DNA-binding SARP family transcriptional activator